MTVNAYEWPICRPIPHDLIARLNERIDVINVAHKMNVEDVAFEPVFAAMLDIAEYYQAGYVGFDRYELYTFENDRDDGWPLAWRLAGCFGIGSGAGNSGQHQIAWSKIFTQVNDAFIKLLGVYHVSTRRRVAGLSGVNIFRIHSLEKKIIGEFDWKNYIC